MPSNNLPDLTKLTSVYLGNRARTTNDKSQQPLQQATLTASYPWGDFPIGHIPFDTVGTVALPALAGDTDIPFVPQVIVPNGFDGVITSYSLNFRGGGFVDGSGDIVWKLLRNGQPIRNFERIISERGSVTSQRSVNNIRIYSGDTITAIVNHVANGVLNGSVIASLTGHFYPQVR